MVIRLKDTAKLFGITIIACCAVFVCTLFLSYNIDLAAIKDVPEYSFDFRALTITLIIFVFTYELVMYLYSRSIKRLSVKSIMLE